MGFIPRFVRLSVFMMAFGLLVLPPASVQAQDEGGDATAADTAAADAVAADTEAVADTQVAGSSGIEEITVTAQKREESLQTAPLSITAFTSTMLEEKGVDGLNDISQFTPNLNIHTNSGGNMGVTISMRGAITSDPLITLEPTVGVYMDGLYVAKSAGSLFQMLDLERVEVLRGPQGTLYGRNTAGGAINLVTKKPHDDLEMKFKVSAGNYASVKALATANLPLIGANGLSSSESLGTLNSRVTFSFQGRDGYFDNRADPAAFFLQGDGTNSSEFDDLDRMSLRTAFRWQPSDAATLDYSFDFHRVREEPTAFQLSGLRDNSFIQFIPGFESFPSYVRGERVGSIGNNKLMEPDGSLHQASAHLDARGHGLTTTVDLGDTAIGHLTLKSLTGYRNVDTEEDQDLDGSPLHIADLHLQTDVEQWSQELQLLGTTDDARWNYVLGLYYYDEKGGEINPQVFLLGTSTNSLNSFDNYSAAVFGQATYVPPVLDDRLSLTAGVRYTNEEKKQERDLECVLSEGVPCEGDADDSFMGKADETFDNFSPMGSVSYQVTDDVMGYAKVARGFKSGGFNGRAGLKEEFETPFDEEVLTSYEVGVKSQWLDNRLRLNASGFFSDYDDMQVAVFIPEVGRTRSILTNAGKAEIWGAEVEMVAVPLEGVDVRASYGWLDPEYKEFGSQCMEDEELVPCDVSDERNFVLSPENTVSVGLGYTAPPCDWGIFSATIDGYWQDEVDFMVKDSDLISEDAYWLFNGRIQLADIATEDGVFDIAFWGYNLFDRKYRNFGIDFGLVEDGGLGYAGNTYGDPRTLGGEIVWRWNP